MRDAGDPSSVVVPSFSCGAVCLQMGIIGIYPTNDFQREVTAALQKIIYRG